MSQAFFLYLGAALVFGWGALWLVLSIRRMRRGSAARSWARVRGRVRAARLESHQTDERDSTTGMSSNVTFWQPKIEYDFRVHGRPYAGSRITVDDAAFRARGRAEALVARFPVGAEVDVFVDPDDPAKSILLPGAGTASFGTLIGGIACMVISAFFIGIFWLIQTVFAKANLPPH